jgi:hypothetical protein
MTPLRSWRVVIDTDLVLAVGRRDGSAPTPEDIHNWLEDLYVHNEILTDPDTAIITTGDGVMISADPSQEMVRISFVTEEEELKFIQNSVNPVIARDLWIGEKH